MRAMSDRGRERDLVLAPNEFAFILDETKGNINVYVGPHKTSLANTDVPVVFDSGTKRFDRKTLDRRSR
jgi:major vault protein